MPLVNCVALGKVFNSLSLSSLICEMGMNKNNSI